MVRRTCTPSTWTLLICLVAAPPVAAQDTRAAEIARKQEEKAARLAPYQPSRVERFLNRLEESLVSPPSGPYPAFGSVYPGGGLTLGAGYRYFYGRRAVWDVTGLYSVRNFKQIEIGTRVPWNLAGRWTAGVRAGWLEAPELAYFGLGMDQPVEARTGYRLSRSYVGGHAAFRPTAWTRLEADVAYENNSLDAGRGRFPPIEARHTPVTAPGLLANPAYIRSHTTAAIDSRHSPGYSRTGGYYGLTFVNYSDVAGTYSFQRLDGQIIQHIPLLYENWVVSLRGRVQTTLDADDVVPYFLLPSLGSGRTLRAYPTDRFRDRHSLLTSAELRWIPNRVGLDMALFYDAGKVASRRSHLDFHNLASNWGIGARFHGPTATVLRIEAARGAPGWHLVFATTAAF
jgi:hypothetical protein